MAHLEPESLNTDGETEQLMDWGSGDTGTPGTPVTVTASVGKRKGPKLRENPLKRQNSAPNICELMSSEDEKKKPKSFSDMIL